MNCCFFIYFIWAFSLILFFFPWASAAKCITHLIFSTGSLRYYLRATCHLFISVLVLCSHLNNCAKRVSRCVVTCRQANANAKAEQSTWVMTIRVCVCVLCLEIKHWCEYAMAGIFIQSFLPFSWISAGFELQPCTHLASHPTPCTIWGTQIHTQRHWSFAKIAHVFKPSEL